MFSLGATPAPASTGAFGFGAPAASTTATFGFGAAAAAPAFGAAPATTSAFAFPSSAPSTTAPSFAGFGAPSPQLFGATPLPKPAVGGFGQPGQPQLGAQPGQQPGLVTYSTRYDDLPADKQTELQGIQREIGNYREDCEKLERDARLHDSVSMKKSMEEETSGLRASLQGMLNSIRADDDALADFREKVLKLLRSTEYAVRTFERAKLWRDVPQQYKGQIIPTQVQEMLASPVVLPSPYLEQAVKGFQQTLDNYRSVIGELEQALPADIAERLGNGDDAGMAQQLPLVIAHMHDFFVHVAARMERLHQEVQKCKDLFIAQRRAEGQYADPFEESRRYLQSVMTPGGTVKTAGGGAHAPSSSGAAGYKAGYSPTHGYAAAVSPMPMPATPFPAAAPPGGFAGAAPTPFGTPFGGAISPAAGDMSRHQAAGGRRRR
ncbi:hypothetical protein FOA52_014439 [Chlamydomonas sp. UWO 241]|nr:hypothetical protein FOA52_014439 [Chlamydomonas sp. UWO 241]